MLIAGRFHSPAAIEESTPVKREPAPVTHNQATARFNSGPAKARGSNQAVPFVRIEPESPGMTLAATQSVDGIQVPFLELTRIAELENQPVDTAIIELSPILDDNNPMVRRATVESIGDMSTESVVLALTTG